MIKGLILLLLITICSMEGSGTISPTEVGAVNSPEEASLALKNLEI